MRKVIVNSTPLIIEKTSLQTIRREVILFRHLHLGHTP